MEKKKMKKVIAVVLLLVTLFTLSPVKAQESDLYWVKVEEESNSPFLSLQSSDGEIYRYRTGATLTMAEDGTVVIADWVSHQLLIGDQVIADGDFRSMTFNNSGELAGVSDTGLISVFDVNGNQKLFNVAVDGNWPIKWSPDGAKILYASFDFQGLFVLDVKTGNTEKIFNIEDSLRDWPISYVWSPDGTRIAWSTSKGIFVDGEKAYDGYIYEIDWVNQNTIVFSDSANHEFRVGKISQTTVTFLATYSYSVPRSITVSPAGDEFAFSLTVFNKEGDFVEDQVVRMQFDGSSEIVARGHVSAPFWITKK